MRTATRRAGGGALAIVAAVLAGAGCGSDQPTVVGDWSAPAKVLRWPVKPFDQPHVIRGTFGEPRGIKGIGHDGATGAAHARLVAMLDQVNTPGLRSIHTGVDILAPDGTPVYALQSGVARLTGEGIERTVVVGSFEYVHIRPAVADGARVIAHHTVLGTILPGEGHVHLTRLYEGNPVNPLVFGGFVGWRDTARPFLGRLRAFGTDGRERSAAAISGPIALFVRAEDPQSQGGQESGLYAMDWQIVDQADRSVWGRRRAFALEVVPDDADQARRLYTTGSTRHRPQTNFWYRVTVGEPDGVVDFGQVAPGCYRLIVTARDAAGNHTTRAYPIGVARGSERPACGSASVA